MLTLVLLSPLAVLGLLVAMAAVERRVLGQPTSRAPSPPDSREGPGTRERG